MKDLYKKYTEAEVYVAMKEFFSSLQVLVRADLRQRWKRLGRQERYAAGRSLVFLNQVIKSPEVFFSRKDTEADWQARAYEWASEKKTDMTAAYYVVQDPAGVVAGAVEKATQHHDLWRNLYKFCHFAQRWEYERTSSKPGQRQMSEEAARRIVQMAKQFKTQANVCQSNPLVRPIKELFCSHSR